jgi:glycine hydroxymethyltransferase
VLVDVRSFGLTGRQAETALESSGVIVNRNSIPNDANGAWYTSGIRLGTPALTTVGMGTAEMDEVADIIASVLVAAEAAPTSTGNSSLAKFNLDQSMIDATRKRSADLLGEHPLYPTLGLL